VQSYVRNRRQMSISEGLAGVRVRSYPRFQPDPMPPSRVHYAPYPLAGLSGGCAGLSGGGCVGCTRSCACAAQRGMGDGFVIGSGSLMGTLAILLVPVMLAGAVAWAYW
jgi:hypothetical protein